MKDNFVYSVSGSNWFPTQRSGLTEQLGGGTYLLQSSPTSGFFLTKIDAYTLPSKIYGTNNKISDRIIKTFEDRSASTGILLTGEKGSGKTLLAKQLSIKLSEKNIPTIIIDSAFTGTDFSNFISSLEESLIIFDEFEKVYCREGNQESLLTILDGVISSKKMYIFTSNDDSGLSSYLMNRPGRIYYSLSYNGLDQEFIREYCDENLKNKEHIESIIRLSALTVLNFDALQALVEEMNRYNETPQESLKFLNINSELNSRFKYSVFYKGVLISESDDRRDPLHLNESLSFDIKKTDRGFVEYISKQSYSYIGKSDPAFICDDEEEFANYFDIKLSPDMITGISGSFIEYKIDERVVVKASPIKNNFNYSSLL